MMKAITYSTLVVFSHLMSVEIPEIVVIGSTYVRHYTYTILLLCC